MKLFGKTLAVALGFVCATAMARERGRPSPIAPAQLTAEEVDKLNNFSDRLLESILKTETNENTFITGPAMMSALTMLTNGATVGSPQAELLQALGYRAGDLKQLNSAVQKLIPALNKKTEGTETQMANALFADASLSLRPEYQNNIQSQFKAVVQNLDFANKSKDSATAINQWAEKSTNGLVTQIIEADALAEMAGLLATAIAFKGNWETQFDPKSTVPSPFMVDERTQKTVSLMSGNLTFLGIADAAKPYVIARLPYSGQTSAMYLILPTLDWSTGKAKISVDDAILSALKSGDIAAIAKKGPGITEFEKEELNLPKFKIKYSNEKLKSNFQEMGVKLVFNQGSLNQISTDPRLKVTYIRLDTALEVDEKGAKAAGVASVGVGLESVRIPTFDFRRPFGVVIRDEATGLNMFAGIVRDPTK